MVFTEHLIEKKKAKHIFGEEIRATEKNGLTKLIYFNKW